MQTRQPDDRLDRGTWRVLAPQRTVEQRPVDVFLQGQIRTPAEARADRIRVIAGRAGEGQYFAGIRVNGHDGTASAGQCVAGRELGIQIDGQDHVLARQRTHALEDPHLAAMCVDDHVLMPGGAMQLGLEAALRCALAHMRGAGIFNADRVRACRRRSGCPHSRAHVRPPRPTGSCVPVGREPRGRESAGGVRRKPPVLRR